MLLVHMQNVMAISFLFEVIEHILKILQKFSLSKMVPVIKANGTMTSANSIIQYENKFGPWEISIKS